MAIGPLGLPSSLRVGDTELLHAAATLTARPAASAAGRTAIAPLRFSPVGELSSWTEGSSRRWAQASESGGGGGRKHCAGLSLNVSGAIGGDGVSQMTAELSAPGEKEILFSVSS